MSSVIFLIRNNLNISYFISLLNYLFSNKKKFPTLFAVDAATLDLSELVEY